MTPSVGRSVHLLDTANKHDVVHAGSDSHNALSESAAAAGAGVLNTGNGDRSHAQPVGKDGRGVTLSLEQVGGVIANVTALDVFDVDALVHVIDQVLEGLNKKVAGGHVAKKRQSGTARPQRWKRDGPTADAWRRVAK